jgi:phosphopantetheine adenylyltransferase
MPEEKEPLESVENKQDETYHTEDDYYQVKRFIESKSTVKKIFSNPKRHEDLKKYILEKNKIKDEMTKISTDDAYGKALGL